MKARRRAPHLFASQFVCLSPTDRHRIVGNLFRPATATNSIIPSIRAWIHSFVNVSSYAPVAPAMKKWGKQGLICNVQVVWMCINVTLVYNCRLLVVCTRRRHRFSSLPLPLSLSLSCPNTLSTHTIASSRLDLYDYHARVSISPWLSLSLYGASSVSTFELTSTDIRTPVAIVLDISVNVNVVYRCRMERARTHPRHPFFNQHRHHQTRPTSISASFRQFTQLKWPNTSKSTSTSSSIDRSIDSTSINECWPPQPPPRSLCHSSLVSIHTIIVIISFINIMKWRRKQ